jgi:molybdenum cofactor synthesis domain-containing protein
MIQVALITISDSVVAGTREDRSGAALASRVAEFGWALAYKKIVSDDEEKISSLLIDLTDGDVEVDLIVTTGGTGVALRDVTPEATAAVSDKKIDGFGELMRLKGMEKTRFAHLSRGGGFTRGRVVIVNVPGSPKGAVESLEAVAELIPHVVDLLHGRTEHRA